MFAVLANERDVGHLIFELAENRLHHKHTSQLLNDIFLEYR